MTWQDMVREYQSLKRQSENCSQRFSELKQKAIGTGGLDYSKDRVQTSPKPHAAFEYTIDQMLEEEIVWNYTLNTMAELAQEMNRYILALDEDDGMIVYYRYILGFCWIEISEKMNMSRRTVLYKHRDAIAAINRMIKEEEG